MRIKSVRHRGILSVVIASILLATAVSRAAPINSLFNPTDYPVLETALVLTGGTVVVDTKDGTVAPTWTYNGATIYTGQIVTNQSGKVVVAMFNFGGLAVSTGVSCTVTGYLGLVLASTGDMTVAGTLDLSGTSGSAGTSGNSAIAGQGGPGAEGGVRTNRFGSAPPGSARGNGGLNGTKGIGFGAGDGNGTVNYEAGGGGGYGGVGGSGYQSGSVAGGTNYGDSAGLLVDLFGGSGGGAGGTNTNSGTPGGGGGGALELVVNGKLTITTNATLKVNGAQPPKSASWRCAGGGSGGGIILAANSLNVYGTIQANGGNGNGDGGIGGGGGGGRIAFYANSLTTNTAMKISVSGGLKINNGTGGTSAGGQNGAGGSYRWFTDGQPGDLGYPFTLALPNVANPIATNIQIRSASLGANLFSTGTDPNTHVYCYWGTNSSSWDFSTDLGSFSAAGYVTTVAAGLTPGTTYFFTFAASNSVGVAFAAVTNNFTTLTPWPTIANAGASNITTSAGTVYGYLSNTGESATVVYLFHGPAPGVWSGIDVIGPGAPGSVSDLLSGFAQNTACYYQFAASNAAGWGYAPTTNWFATLPVLGRAAQQDSLFDPQRYTTVADSLRVSNGTIVIDTGDGTNRGPSMTVNGFMYRGQVVPNQSGSVWLSLFDFGSLAISNGVSCTVTGNLGLVLASMHDLTIGTTLDLSGMGSSSAGGPGGPGAEGGARKSSTNSAPPGLTRGNGGFNGQNGTGFGAGAIDTGKNVAGGGGYGGAGGAGSITNAEGGPNYGDSALTNLLGGSGGGGATVNGVNTSGGGGGGSLELVALGTLTVSATATQKVNGGTAGSAAGYRSAGGGSGGGIILAATRLVVAGAVQAKGGNGAGAGGSSPSGGGGGGGRIAFYANSLTTNATMSVSVAGGLQAGGAAQNGAIGSFRYPLDGGPGVLTFPFAVHGTLLLLK